LEQAATLAPKNGRVLTYLGCALRQVDRYRDAVLAGETAVKLLPRDAEAWYQLGLTYYRPTGKQGQGRECFKRAVELDPNNAVYHRDYASSFSDVGEYAEAEREAREAVRLNPTDPVARYLLGKILHRSHASSTETVEALKEAVRLSPTTFQPHYELGLVLEESGDYASALKEFELSSRINGRHQQSWFHQSNTAARLGRTAQATAARQQFQRLTRDRDERQFLERRVFDHPNDATLRLRFAAVLERNDDLLGAAAQCQAILKKTPQHPAARAMLGRLAKKAGVPPEGEAPK
jgi:tetratricopeptide (TPR) repeat protein